ATRRRARVWRPVLSLGRASHAVAANPSIAASFAGLAAHRLAFGISTLLTLLLYRYAFTAIGPLRAGLPGIGEALAVAASGLLCAALVTPRLVHRVGRPWAIRGAPGGARG